jgi:hypothetical protein
MKKIKQQEIMYPKISFCATTDKWAYSWRLNIDLCVDAGCSYCISWGDGKQDEYAGTGKTVVLFHEYYPDEIFLERMLTFYVEIFGIDDNCRITEFILYNVEMIISELNLTHCVELEALVCQLMHHPITLDLSKNTALRYLDCMFSKLSELDVSNNTELVELYCDCNRIKKLDLSNNIKLRVLDCTYNEIYVLLIWYGSQLRNALFTEGNEIDGYAENEIMDIVNTNPPVKDCELYYYQAFLKHFYDTTEMRGVLRLYDKIRLFMKEYDNGLKYKDTDHLIKAYGIKQDAKSIRRY